MCSCGFESASESAKGEPNNKRDAAAAGPVRPRPPSDSCLLRPLLDVSCDLIHKMAAASTGDLNASKLDVRTRYAASVSPRAGLTGMGEQQLSASAEFIIFRTVRLNSEFNIQNDSNMRIGSKPVLVDGIKGKAKYNRIGEILESPKTGKEGKNPLWAVRAPGRSGCVRLARTKYPLKYYGGRR
ncbi:hypothetical protein EVAR_8989_1 [Eumeta japonica]|uniref:Uncharacterized protein n=1 Tax=Eumeta variegata TaxID=151549 RepID=A0A4C1WRM6_EUMVA|nr:hypothetical protein EVAR_8989_1 [Eumeta japonica]